MKYLFYSMLVVLSLTSCSKKYVSNDLHTYNLFGNVKSVNTMHINSDGTDGYGEVLNFDNEGLLEADFIKVTRDDIGYITSLDFDFGGVRFKYDIDYNVIERTDWDTSTLSEYVTKRDQYNNPLESEQYGETPREIEESPIGYYKYTYLDIDDHDNWLLRMVEFEDSYKKYVWSEKRMIDYYK